MRRRPRFINTNPGRAAARECMVCGTLRPSVLCIIQRTGERTADYENFAVRPPGKKTLRSHVTVGLEAIRLFYQLNSGCRSSKMTRPPLALLTNWGLTPTRIPRREIDCPLPAPDCQTPLRYCLARRRFDCSPPHVCRDDDDDDVVQ